MGNPKTIEVFILDWTTVFEPRLFVVDLPVISTTDCSLKLVSNWKSEIFTPYTIGIKISTLMTCECWHKNEKKNSSTFTCRKLHKKSRQMNKWICKAVIYWPCLTLQKSRKELRCCPRAKGKRCQSKKSNTKYNRLGRGNAKRKQPLWPDSER